VRTETAHSGQVMPSAAARRRRGTGEGGGFGRARTA